MKKLLLTLALSVIIASHGFAQTSENLPDVQYYGYKVVHHMGAEVKHIEKFGFNTFDHPRMAHYRAFVITPVI